MTITADTVRAALATASLELLLTSPVAFGLTTATPLQRACCRIMDGVPLGALADDAAVQRSLGDVDMSTLPERVPTEFVLLGGVRSAKSLLCAALAVRCSQRVDVSGLRPGEVPRVSVVSLDKDKARVVFAEHLVGTILASPTLRTLVMEEPKGDSMLLRHPSGRPVEVMVVAGKRAGGSLVARWSAGAIFDEAPRMVGSDDGVVNLDDARKAVLARLLPGSLLAEVGSPWAPFGPVYELTTTYWGKPSKDCVVIRARGPDMNPSWWTPERCEALRLREPDAHRTDVEGEFMTPEENLLSGDLLDACTRIGPVNLPYNPLAAYWAAMDPATRGNSWTLVIGTREGAKRKVAFAKQWTGTATAPLSPKATMREIGEALRTYGLHAVESDQYQVDSLKDIGRDVVLEDGTAWPVRILQTDLNSQDKAQRYLSLRTKLGEGEIELSPLPEMQTDLRRIVRRVTQAGIVIDLPRTGDGRHCDYAPALMLVATRNMADVKDPPLVKKDAETERALQQMIARLRASKDDS